MVLEMPVIAPVSHKRDVVQKQLNTAYEGQIAQLKQQYEIDEEARVAAFLRSRRHLIPVLQEGRTAVNIVFGEETPILLQMQRDPETGFEYLIAWVRTALPAAAAVDRMLELDDAWFGDQLDRVGDDLNFNLGVP